MEQPKFLLLFVNNTGNIPQRKICLKSKFSTKNGFKDWGPIWSFRLRRHLSKSRTFAVFLNVNTQKGVSSKHCFSSYKINKYFQVSEFIFLCGHEFFLQNHKPRHFVSFNASLELFFKSGLSCPDGQSLLEHTFSGNLVFGLETPSRTVLCIFSNDCQMKTG